MSLPAKIHLEIVTPDRQLFSGPVDEVTVPSTTGYLGILPGHAPLLAELGIGEVVADRLAHREATQVYTRLSVRYVGAPPAHTPRVEVFRLTR